MTKFNSKSNKSTLVSYIVANFGPGSDKPEGLAKKLKKELLAIALDVKAQLDKQAAQPEPKKVDGEHPENCRCEHKHLHGKRTSKPGALAFFRETVNTDGFSMGRKELIATMESTFGAKAKWAALNYIALAKKGALKNCPTLTEVEGVLAV